jgi:hypothetical protein
MDEEREKIMNMLAEGTITVEEAYELLDVIEAAQPAAPMAATGQTEHIEPQRRPEASQAGNLFANLTLDQLIQLRMHGVSPEFIRGVDPEFIRAVWAAGLGDLPVEKLIEMRIHGVDPEFIQAMRQVGA